MPASTVLVIGSDRAALDQIRSVLTGAGYQVSDLEDAEEALRVVADHHVVVIDALKGPRSASDVCSEIRRTPALAAVPVLCIAQGDDVEDRVRFLEAGADDVIARPFDARELEARIEALLLRFQHSRGVAPTTLASAMPAPVRRLVACFSPKGGVGTTTLAVNMAVALAQRRPDRVAIVDLDPQFGQVATHLNITPRQTIAELSRDETALDEPDLLRTYAERAEPGLHVYAAPGSPATAELVTPQAVGRILATATSRYDAVIADGGSFVDERTLALFERADSVVFVVHPEIAALKALHSLLEFLAESGIVGSKTLFVVNHLFAREMLKPRDIENLLGSRIAIEIPHDTFVYLKAVNEGIPVVVGAPRSQAAARLTKLAAIAIGEAASEAGAADGERRGLLGIKLGI